MSATQLRCPICSGRLEIASVTTVREYHSGYHVAGTRLPEKEEQTTAALCQGCEFVIDLEYPGHTMRPAESLTAEIELLMRGVQ